MNPGYDILDPCRVKVKKGGGAPVPTLQGGDFPLRPLHPRKLKVGLLMAAIKKAGLTKEEFLELL